MHLFRHTGADSHIPQFIVHLLELTLTHLTSPDDVVGPAYVDAAVRFSCSTVNCFELSGNRVRGQLTSGLSRESPDFALPIGSPHFSLPCCGKYAHF